MDEHWYYLHTNGSLIHKRSWPGEDNSDFVRRIWKCNLANRATAWKIILESLALGASVFRVRKLAAKWRCDAKDFVGFIMQNATHTKYEHEGAPKFLQDIVGVQPDVFWDWLALTPKGSEPDWPSMPVAAEHESVAPAAALET